MILLPSPPSPASLRGFWTFISLITGLVTSTVLGVLGPARWGWIGLLVAISLAVPGLLRPALVSLPYRIWNGLARRYSEGASRYVSAVCFVTVTVPVSRASDPGRFHRSVHTRSSWVPRAGSAAKPPGGAGRDAQAPGSYASLHNSGGEKPPPGGWIATMWRWARTSGNVWTWFLLPFLVLLRTLDTDRGAKAQSSLPSGDIYTLY